LLLQLTFGASGVMVPPAQMEAWMPDNVAEVITGFVFTVITCCTCGLLHCPPGLVTTSEMV
jgi:hypothetical protein